MSELGRNSAFPDWLITAKVHPAIHHIDLLPRDALVTRLDRAPDRSLTILHAPAGYGKSTALVGWRSVLLARQVRVAWASLDRDDNDPGQLVLYLALALSVAGIDLSKCDLASRSRDDERSARRLLNSLHGIVERDRNRTVLMLDDFENLSARIAEEMIVPLVRYAPDNLQIAIASRDDSNLKISDLDMRGLVHRVGAEDLRFTFEQLVEFLHPALDMAQVRKVFDITEGWPVAVQLLKSASRSAQGVRPLLYSLGGAGSKMAAYLAEHVLADLRGELRKFVADISVVDRIDPELADFLRESDDSASLFHELRHLDALITPIDGAHGSWRLHPLFREYLYDDLCLGNRDRATRLHGRAARWFGDRDCLAQSVRHHVSANDQAGGAAVVENSGGLMRWLSEGLTPLGSALGLLDPETVRSRPRLALIQCLILIKTGRSYEASQLFESTVAGLSDKATAAPPLAYELLVIESLLYAYDARALSDDFFRKLEESGAALPLQQPIYRGHHLMVLCGLNASCGQFLRARKLGIAAIGAFREAGSAYGEIYVHVHLGIVAFRRGETDAAQGYYDHALKLIRSHFRDDKAMKLIVAVLVAELRYDLNHLNRIPRKTVKCPKQLERYEAWFDIYAAAYVTASNIAANHYATDVALSIIDEGLDFAAQRHFVSLHNVITCQKVTLLLRAGKNADAEATMANSGLSTSSFKPGGARSVSWRERDMVAQTIVRLYLARKQFRKALNEIDAFLRVAESEINVRSIATYRILRALACYIGSDYDAAAAELRHALSLARASGSIRVFLDEGPPMPALLKLVASQADDAESAQRASNGSGAHVSRDVAGTRDAVDSTRILNELVREQSDQPESHLSARELEILRELASGHSNKVIARNLGISHNTVRYHLKNVFLKLNVHSRLSAVRAAQEADII